jgi:hypothetical protein
MRSGTSFESTLRKTYPVNTVSNLTWLLSICLFMISLPLKSNSWKERSNHEQTRLKGSKGEGPVYFYPGDYHLEKQVKLHGREPDRSFTRV